MTSGPGRAARSGTSGWRIGRIAGTPLILTPGSFVLGLALFVFFLPNFQSALGDGAATYAFAAALPVGLLASVLVHELAHGLVARRLGVPVTEYVLTVWGGHTAFERGVRDPGPSALIAVAGPAANGVLAVVAFFLAGSWGGPWGYVLAAVAYLNLILAVFNVLPGLPMDGGRLLEALVWRTTGNRSTGTLIAARGGQALAVAVIVFVLSSSLLRGTMPGPLRILWAVLIAGVLWMGARSEVRRAKAQRASAGLDLASMLTPVQVLHSTGTVADLQDHSGTTVLVSAEGYPRGLVDAAAADSVPVKDRPTTPLTAVALALGPRGVLTELTGTAAVTQVARAAQAGLAVLVAIRQDPGRGTVDVLGAIEVEAVIRALGA